MTAVDTLASHVLAPCFAALQLGSPEVALELVADVRHLSLAMREADIAVRLAPFEGHDLVVRRISALAYSLKRLRTDYVDLTLIHGIGSSLALKLVAECGTDLVAWPSAKHFTSWLCLAPSNKVSGGKLLSGGTRHSNSRAGAALRMAGVAGGRTEAALGAFYRRLSARVGKAKAITATARKLAVLFYNTLRHGLDYSDPGASYYEERYRKRMLTNLKRRAKSLGYVLQAAPPETAVS